MGQRSKARFATVQEALRFYFRAQELLAANCLGEERPGERARGSQPAAPDVIRDYFEIGRAVGGLDRFEAWLLAELYGPTCFYARDRSLRRAYAAARRNFADGCSSRRDLARIHRTLIQRLAGEFRHAGLIETSLSVRSLDTSRPL